MEIKIVVNGKLKEKIYLRRIKKYLEWISKDVKIEIIHIKDSNKNNILTKIDRLKRINFFSICLSENGIQMSSNAFSKFIFNNKEKLSFIIGGPDGQSSEILNEADYILSLSKMTMPHEMATLVLIEQIYRAFSIKKGSKYHRE